MEQQQNDAPAQAEVVQVGPWRDPWAVLDTVELVKAPDGFGVHTLAVCVEHPGETVKMGVAGGREGSPAGSLALQVAAHRRLEHAGPPVCVCPVPPNDLDPAVVPEVNEACPDHGVIAQALEASEEYESMTNGVLPLLGADMDRMSSGPRPEPFEIMGAIAQALVLAKRALQGVDRLCPEHGEDYQYAANGSGVIACESCRQPALVWSALFALDAFAPTGAPAAEVPA